MATPSSSGCTRTARLATPARGAASTTLRRTRSSLEPEAESLQLYTGSLYTHAMSEKKTVAVVGANGYAGGTAVQLLLRHPNVDLVRATSRSYAGQKLSTAVPGVESDLELVAEPDPGEADIVV